MTDKLKVLYFTALKEKNMKIVIKQKVNSR